MLDKVGLLAHPALQGVIRKAADLRSDLVEHLDGGLAQLAKHLKLHTRAEVTEFKRLIRELENQVDSLVHQLSFERARADQHERTIADLTKTHKKTLQHAESTAVELHQYDELRENLQAELNAAKDALLKAESALKDKNEDLARLEGELKAAKEALTRQDADLKQANQAVVEAKVEIPSSEGTASAAPSPVAKHPPKKNSKVKKGSSSKG